MRSTLDTMKREDTFKLHLIADSHFDIARVQDWISSSPLLLFNAKPDADAFISRVDP